jgi:hypothetical protein
MEELKVSQQSGVITTNLETIERGLKEYLKDYEGYVVTQDSITDDKKVLADLRKLQKSLDDARKSVKKEWEKPYKEFEEKCKKVVALVDEPINLISQQLKMFDEQRALEKLEHVKEIYAEAIGDLDEYLPFEKVFNEKWLNVSTKEKDIQFDISEAKTRVISDLDILKSLNSEIEEELIKVYKANDNNLASAIQRNNQYMQDKARVQARNEEVKTEEKKAEEERPQSEAVKELNDLVEMVKTVHIIVSKDDLQAALNALDFSEIKYQVIKN